MSGRLLSNSAKQKRLPSGAALIAAERRRQRREEGYSAAHDDQHNLGEIARAAACYAAPYEARLRRGDSTLPVGWPWQISDWRPSPKDRKRELVKAGALIAAEIDRLQRLEP